LFWRIHVDSGHDDADIQSNERPLTKSNISHHHQSIDNLKIGTCNLIFYQFIYDFLNGFVYGCNLSTTFAQHRLIALVLWLVILTEGFQRHLRKIDFLFHNRVRLLIPFI
jgi:hypothetical protein